MENDFISEEELWGRLLDGGFYARDSRYEDCSVIL